MNIRNRDYKSAKKSIESIILHKEEYVLICYTCENESDVKFNRTPRITSIIVRRLDNKQATSFSISQELELLQTSKACKENLDNAEKNMLSNFYFYAEHECAEKKWLHWRMNDSIYGFSALEIRYKILGGNPYNIPSNNRIDICALFKKRYGEKFVKNEKWRIKYLAEKNKIETAGFLGINDEAKAFREKDYKKLLDSPARKTSIFIIFLELSSQNKFETDSSWREIHGFSIQGIYDYLKEKWWFNFAVFILGIALGGLLSLIF